MKDFIDGLAQNLNIIPDNTTVYTRVTLGATTPLSQPFNFLAQPWSSNQSIFRQLLAVASPQYPQVARSQYSR